MARGSHLSALWCPNDLRLAADVADMLELMLGRCASKSMYVEAILRLMRMTQSSEKVVASLATMALNLVESIKEAETRAGLAEAALEAERAKVAELCEAVHRLGGADRALTA